MILSIFNRMMDIREDIMIIKDTFKMFMRVMKMILSILSRMMDVREDYNDN